MYGLIFMDQTLLWKLKPEILENLLKAEFLKIEFPLYLANILFRFLKHAFTIFFIMTVFYVKRDRDPLGKSSCVVYFLYRFRTAFPKSSKFIHSFKLKYGEL